MEESIDELHHCISHTSGSQLTKQKSPTVWLMSCRIKAVPLSHSLSLLARDLTIHNSSNSSVITVIMPIKIIFLKSGLRLYLYIAKN